MTSLLPISECLMVLLRVQFINDNFFAGQGRTKVCGGAYLTYAAAGNLRRTPPSGKKALYGWSLANYLRLRSSSTNLTIASTNTSRGKAFLSTKVAAIKE